jgi:hypothetical protein
MKGHDFIIGNIVEYIQIVYKIYKQENVCWFRGQPDATYHLIQSLYRNQLLRCDATEAYVCSINTSHRSIPFRFKNDPIKILEEFKKRGTPFLEKMPQNNFEWLVLLQHYGGITQLLDWTKNPLIALYFAINSPGKNDFNEYNDEYDIEESIDYIIKNAIENSKYMNTYDFIHKKYNEYKVIYIINPIKINQLIGKSDGINNNAGILDSNNIADLEIINKYIEFNGFCNFPVCVNSPINNKRAYIQGSRFTLHGIYVDSLDWFTNMRENIYKIYIDVNKIQSIKIELNDLFGIDRAYVFQDITNLISSLY